jgi:hypothetical protein
MFAVVFSYNIADPDLWGHVRYGEQMLEQGGIFATDPYSYLSNGFPWINHELLCEFTLGFLEPRFGAVGLLIWKCLMGLLTIAPLVWAHRRSAFEPLTVVAVAVLLACSLWPGWTVRPQLFTAVFLSLLALIMTEHTHGSRRALWFVPPLMVAWTNAHGGFVAGLGVFGVHVAWRLWSEVRRRTSGWRGRVCELVLVLIATAAATLVNPYGPRLLLWVWDSLTWPRPEISEWWPVSVWSLDYLPFKALVVLTATSLLFSKRPLDRNQLTILVLAGIQACMHRRHTMLFAILAAYWVPEHMNDCWIRLRALVIGRAKLAEAHIGTVRMHRDALVALILLFGMVTALQARSLRVEKAAYPVSAFEFIEQHGLEGRMVTEFNWGQYCLYAFWPRILISVDGRFDTSYSRQVLDLNLDFMMGDHQRFRNRSPETGSFQADRILDLGDPNLALVDRQRSDCVRTIEQRSDWVLLYQDAVAQVWGRRSIYDDPANPDYIPAAARAISDATQVGWAAYPACPTK